MPSRKPQRIAALSIFALAFAVSGFLPMAGSFTPAADAAPEPEAYPTPAATTAPTITYGASTIRLKAGSHQVVRLGTKGKVLEQRSIRLLRARVWSTPTQESTFTSGSFAKLTSGPWSGWWVPARNTSGVSAASFSPALEVTVRSGKLVARRFYESSVSRRVAYLSSQARYTASRRAVFNGNTHYLMADGPFAGRWIAATRVIVGTSSPVAAPSPTATANATPKATPTATPQPTEAAVRSTWKTVVLLYRETDVTFTRSNGQQYRLQARMTNTMYDLVRDTLGRFQTSVRSWSGGLARVDMTIVDVPHPLTNLDALGSDYWVGPNAVRNDMNTYAPVGAYDSIIVVYQPKDTSGVAIPVPGWGLTIPDGSWSNRAGFSSVITPAQLWWWTDSAVPEDVFVHEWLHQVLFFHERHGRTSLDLHAGHDFGYSAVNGSWKAWYSDVMQGKVKDGNKLIGITGDIWAAGKPSAP